jgi:hypothetical protein
MSHTDERRQELFGLLGDLPDRDRAVTGKVLSISKEKSYILERLVLDLNGLEPVPAFLVKPPTGESFPCVLYHHAHGGDYLWGRMN